MRVRKVTDNPIPFDEKSRQAIRNLVEEEMCKNGYKRDEDPLVVEINRLMKKYL